MVMLLPMNYRDRNKKSYFRAKFIQRESCREENKVSNFPVNNDSRSYCPMLKMGQR